MNKPILCLDFDGVCSTYASGWLGADVCNDPATPGLFEFLEQVVPYFDIHVFSSRSNTPEGITAMQGWFYKQRKLWRENGGKGSEVISIKFPTEKPLAFITIDDRAITFNGEWPDIAFLRAFKPYWKKAA